MRAPSPQNLRHTETKISLPFEETAAEGNRTSEVYIQMHAQLLDEPVHM